MPQRKSLTATEVEQNRRMELYNQSFMMRLVALVCTELQQAQENGDELKAMCLQAQLDHYGPVIIDGSSGYLALPERKAS